MKYALIALVLALGCMSSQVVPPPVPTADCSNGKGHDDIGYGALVCINRDSMGNITANPDRVTVHSRHDIVLMLSDGAGDLDVQFPAAVKVHGHQHGCGGGVGRSTYRATAKVVDQHQAGIKYRIIDRESEKEQDPDVMIDP